MNLAPVTRLGAYEIVGFIGAGGMGEVYRARDTQLGRDVAFKILPELFAAAVDCIARCQLEPFLIAFLNHPNIAQIYGLENIMTSKPPDFELVDGPSRGRVIALVRIRIVDVLPVAK